MSDWYLNGTKLCPWNLSLSEGFRVKGGDAEMLDGSLRRDVVARKRVYKLKWEFLEESFNGTHHSYSDLQSLGTVSGTMTFIRPTGTSGTAQYKVFCSTPDADFEFADTSNVYWNPSITLAEA